MATTEEYGALLTALALIDAYAERDEDSISALLDGIDAAPVVSNLLEIMQRLLNILAVVTEDDPRAPIELLRSQTLNQMAAQGFTK
jgi:hypothetical protein